VAGLSQGAADAVYICATTVEVDRNDGLDPFTARLAQQSH
jgi:hypothetical protein